MPTLSTFIYQDSLSIWLFFWRKLNSKHVTLHLQLYDTFSDGSINTIQRLCWWWLRCCWCSMANNFIWFNLFYVCPYPQMFVNVVQRWLRSCALYISIFYIWNLVLSQSCHSISHYLLLAICFIVYYFFLFLFPRMYVQHSPHYMKSFLILYAIYHLQFKVRRPQHIFFPLIHCISLFLYHLQFHSQFVKCTNYVAKWKILMA